MTEQEWKARCAARYVLKAELKQEDAEAAAQVCWEETDGDPLQTSPEEAADEDMACWTDDEGTG